MSPPQKPQPKSPKELENEKLEIARQQKIAAFRETIREKTPEELEKLRMEREQIALQVHKNQLQEWLRTHQDGEIYHAAQKALEVVHWTSHEVQSKKAQLVQLELQFSHEKQRIEQEIIALERNQSQRKIHYDLCMDAVHQERKFAPLPKPLPPLPEKIIPEKKKSKKKKMVEVEVDEEEGINGELHDSGKSSP